MAASKSTSRSASPTCSARRGALVAALAASALIGAPACGAGQRGEAVHADLVLVGGEVTTLDPAAPGARAIAVVGERIAAVGDDAVVRSWIGPGTRVVDLKGRAVTPGLVDAHCHLYDLGESLELIALRGVTSEADAVAKVAAAAAAMPAGEWAIGHGWDQNLWPDKQFPTAAALDRAVGDRPVALSRIDGHAVWVSSAALRLAGIDGKTPDPAGGRILRDRDGEATGVLTDNAMGLVEGHIPKPTIDVRRRRIAAAAKAAVAMGLTGVHEMGTDEPTSVAFRTLADEHRLLLRVHAYLDGSPAVAATLDERIAQIDRTGEAMFVLRGVKFFADGALGSRGARLLAPYADEPQSSGSWVTEPAALAEAIEAATAAGWQVAVHAIGDAGVRAVLEAFERTHARHPEARLRLEHAQVIALEDLDRIARAGAIASMQPVHATSDMPWAEARLGAERIRGAYAWRALDDAGVPLAFGSDFPYDEPSPLRGLHAAVNRQDAAGQPAGGWQPQQKLALAEALEAYTVGAARAAFAEEHRGRIRVGMVADLTVFDRPLRPEHLLETRVDLTVVGGRVVFERE